jgi:hypothetical protein
VLKLLVGILKGAVIGGALGYGAYALGEVPVLTNPWVLYGLIGVIVGLFVGKPIWTLIRDQNATIWIAVLKGAFGFGIGCGLYALIAKVIDPSLAISTIPNVFAWPPALGGAIGALYGGFVELDDAIGEDPSKKPAPARKPATKLPPGDDEV